MIDRVFLVIYIMVLLAIALISDYAAADNHLTETRFCGEPKRYKDGRLKRSVTVIAEFERLYPLPSKYDRADWQVDHVIPLASGGCDAIRNLQWLPKTIKTCADDDCKDRWERLGIYK